MTDRTRRAGLLLLGLAGIAVLGLAWQAYDRVGLILLLQGFPFCG